MHCAVRSAIRGRTNRAAWVKTVELSWASVFSLDYFQNIRFGGSEALVRLLQELLGDRQVYQRRVDIAMTKVGGQMCQPALGIDPLLIPLRHPMDDERMPKVMNARPTT